VRLLDQAPERVAGAEHAPREDVPVRARGEGEAQLAPAQRLDRGRHLAQVRGQRPERLRQRADLVPRPVLAPLLHVAGGDRRGRGGDRLQGPGDRADQERAEAGGEEHRDDEGDDHVPLGLVPDPVAVGVGPVAERVVSRDQALEPLPGLVGPDLRVLRPPHRRGGVLVVDRRPGLLVGGEPPGLGGRECLPAPAVLVVQVGRGVVLRRLRQGGQLFPAQPPLLVEPGGVVPLQGQERVPGVELDPGAPLLEPDQGEEGRGQLVGEFVQLCRNVTHPVDADAAEERHRAEGERQAEPELALDREPPEEDHVPTVPATPAPKRSICPGARGYPVPPVQGKPVLMGDATGSEWRTSASRN
jgi:hypothetical protein